jgi:hypothetical protein
VEKAVVLVSRRENGAEDTIFGNARPMWQAFDVARAYVRAFPSSEVNVISEKDVQKLRNVKYMPCCMEVQGGK